MTKKFKILDTNLEDVKETHFVCETEIGTETILFGEETPFRTFMFDGLHVKLVQDKKYVYGEVHG